MSLELYNRLEQLIDESTLIQNLNFDSNYNNNNNTINYSYTPIDMDDFTSPDNFFNAISNYIRRLNQKLESSGIRFRITYSSSANGYTTSIKEETFTPTRYHSPRRQTSPRRQRSPSRNSGSSSSSSSLQLTFGKTRKYKNRK
jgi:hypothetical protein